AKHGIRERRGGIRKAAAHLADGARTFERVVGCAATRDRADRDRAHRRAPGSRSGATGERHPDACTGGIVTTNDASEKWDLLATRVYDECRVQYCTPPSL